MKVDRLNAIRQHLYANGPTSIGDLSKAVGASVATVHRDLQVLEQSGAIDRVHGGAQIAEGTTVEIDFEMREKQGLAAKRAIAAAAFPLIQPHSAIFLDSGTTVLQVARRLRLSTMPLSVFTNSLKVAQELFNVPKITVFVIGGYVRHENASLVGSQAEAAVRSLWFDVLLLGAGAITSDGRICTIDGGEASLNECMLARSSKQLILADSGKFGRTSTFTVGSVPTTATIVTDAGLSEEWQRRVSDWGVGLVIADASGSDTD